MNEYSQKYLEKAYDCLEDADYLLAGNRVEAAANRTYYAIFDAVQALLVNENIAAKSHSGTHNKFRELFIKSNIFPIEVNKMLTDSFNMRQGGDYENDFDLEKEDIEDVLTQAKKFVKDVEIYLKDDSKN